LQNPLLVLPFLTTVLAAGEEPTRRRAAHLASLPPAVEATEVEGSREGLAACEGDRSDGRLVFSVQGSEGLAKLQGVEDVLATIIEGLFGFCHATLRIINRLDSTSAPCEPSCQVMVSYGGICFGRCFVAPLDEVGHLDKSIRYGLAQRGLHFRVFNSNVSLSERPSERPDLHGAHAQLDGGPPEEVHTGEPGERKRRWRKNLLTYWILPTLFLAFLVCAISAVGHTCKGDDVTSRDRVVHAFAKQEL
jgi:hypothetical protein